MKKLISIILSLMLVMSTLPMIASAETTLDPIVATDDCPVRNFSDGNKVLNKENDGYNWLYNDVSYTTPTYYNFELPEIPEGQAVSEAKFKVVYKSLPNLSSTFDFQLRFYPVDAVWSQDTLTYYNQPLAFKDLHYPEEEPALTFDVPANGYTDYSQEYDISSMVRKYLASGSENPFSFATIIYYEGQNSGSSHTNIYSLENTDASLHPTLTLTLDAITAPELQLVSIEDGATIAPDEDIEFTFNNAIESANISVKDFTGADVAISEDDYSFNGSKIILEKEWDSYSKYTVTISDITDSFGQKSEENVTLSFKTSANASTVENVTVAIKDSARLQDGSASCGTDDRYFWPSAGNKQNGYIIYRFELPEVEGGKVVSSASLSYWQYYDWMGTDRFFEVPYGEWTNDSQIDDSYMTAVDTAVENGTSIGSYEYDLGNSYKFDNGIADITAAVAAAIESGETKFAVTLTGGDNNNNTYTRYLYHEKGGSFAPVINVTLATPEIAVVESVPEKGGNMNGVASPVEMTMATSIVDTEENLAFVELVKASDNSKIDAFVSFDKETSKLIVTPKEELAERTAYKVILKSGFADAFGTALAEDMVATAFTTTTALEFFGIKFTAEEIPVYDECEEIDSYKAGDSVTAVAKINNGSSKDLDAVMIIAVYGEDDKLIAVDAFGGKSCAPANEETQYSKSITIPDDAVGTKVKAFIWDGLNNIRPMFDFVEINQAQ